MKPVIELRKCPALDTCPVIEACPEGAVRHAADKNLKLGGRIVIELSICTGCGDCVSACCGNAIAIAEEIPILKQETQEKGELNMLTVKVLGSGCQNCVNLASIAQRAITTLSIDAKVEKVTDYAEFAKYRLMATPGLVINEKLVSAGRIPSEAEITTFLVNAMMEE